MTEWQSAFDAKAAETFLRYVDRRGVNECWLYRGSKASGGYGSFAFMRNRKRWGIPAHRVAFFLSRDYLPPSPMQICHRCDVPACVNPAHLFPGTARDNARDKIAKGRQTRGAQIPWSKLTDERAERIRQWRAEGGSLREIARAFGVSEANVSMVARGLRWKGTAA